MGGDSGRMGVPEGQLAGPAGAAVEGDPAGAAPELGLAGAALMASSAAHLAPPPDMLPQAGQQVPCAVPARHRRSCVRRVPLHTLGLTFSYAPAGHAVTGWPAGSSCNL